MTRRSAPSRFLAALALLALSAPPALAWQDTDTQAGAEARQKAQSKGRRRPQIDPHAPGMYMGRPIAQTMSFMGAGWLFRPEREMEEQPDKMLDALEIKPGMTVADVGAGAGYTTLRLAQRVGPEGTVLSTDIQPQMLRMLQANVKQAGFTNVTPILCTQTDPKLPEGQVDLIIMVDVYHEVAEPEVALKGWRKALKPGGRFVLVEFRGEDPDVPIKPEHKMTVEQVRKEVEPAGFSLAKLHDFLPWQHVLVFEKTADKAPADADAGAVSKQEKP